MTMRFSVSTAALCAALFLAGCGGGGPPGGPRGAGGFSAAPVGVNQPSQLLSRARDMQAKEGCAKAAPVYRIVASHGEGHDIAQYELGACLLQMESDSDAETALFRQEALFWLSRAAWAGNARAQGKLAETLSGAAPYKATFVASDPVEAMKWAIVYDANGTRETYGLRALPQLVRDHLSSALTPEGLSAAQSEASSFRRISMSEFVPFGRSSEEGGDALRQSGDTQRPPEGRQRRPQ